MQNPSPAPARFGNPNAGAGSPEAPAIPPNGTPGNPRPGEPAADPGAGDGEVDVLITPRAAVLDELQVTEAEFEWALGRCLDLLEEGPEEEETPALEDVEIVLNGRTFRLEEVATVEIGGDLTELGPLPDPGEEE